MSKFLSRKKAKILAALFISLCAAFVFSAPAALADGMDYDTTSFNVKVNVQSDNSAYITENIGVDIQEPMHGIYRYIPLSKRMEYKDDDGNVIRSSMASMKVQDISVTNDKFKVSTEMDNKVIRIGDEDKLVEGMKDYELSYRVRFYDDGVSEYDSFYYNVLPFDWETPIDQSTITIVMPKQVKKSNIDVIAGQGGSFDDDIEWTLQGKTITIKAKEQLPRGVGITVGMKLPEGYFTGEMSHRFSNIFMLIIAALSSIIMLVLWFRFGRDPKSIQTVEFYPPEGMTSADIGYIIDGTVDKEDVVSLLFYFAQQGYIAIEEDGKDYIIHRLTELPPSVKPYESVFFDGLFEDGDSVRMSDLKESFYDTYEATREMIGSSFKKRKDRIFPSSASWSRVVVALLSILAFGAIGAISYFAYRDFVSVLATGVALILSIVAAIKGVRTQDRKYVKSAASKVANTVFSLILMALSAAAMFYLAYYQDLGLVMEIAFCAVPVATYFAMRFMQSRTKLGADLLGKVLGFKEFLRVAERDRLEMLLDQDPQYYYNVLPYAYVLGMEKKWAKKFEGIAMEQPDWYVTRSGDTMFNTWLFYGMCRDFSRSASASIRMPVSDSGGGSFGGGGFSGGGGFGGGGGGGW